eukprot:jgi/Botrbrau1/3657/Bobra.0204s0047.1
MSHWLQLVPIFWILATSLVFGEQLKDVARGPTHYVSYRPFFCLCGHDVNYTTEVYRLVAQDRWHEPLLKPEILDSCTSIGLLFVCQVPKESSDVHTSFIQRHGRHWRGSFHWAWRFLGEPNSLQKRKDEIKKRQVLAIALQNETTVSPAAYTRAVSQGDPTRLRLALKKLVAGEAVKVVMLGGSVTAGMGVADRNESFAGLLSKWFHAFHPLVGGHVKFINSAVAATTSSYTSQCLPNFVPSDVDIVFLEFALNDYEGLPTRTTASMDNYQRRGYERLLRKLLDYPNAPAIIPVYWWAGIRHNFTFWDVAEDQLETLAKYYELSSISFRNAYYKQIMTAAQGFNLSRIMCDEVHPNHLGHRYLADLIIAYLQQSLAEALLLPPDTAPRLEGFPPPLFEGNNASFTGKCVRDNDFKNTVVEAQGFHWSNQAKPGAPQEKWGYVGTEAGSYVKIQVGQGRGKDGVIPASRQTYVSVGMLKSYEGMGVANLSCNSSTVVEGTCSCGTRQIDMQHQQKISQVYWIGHLVTTGPDCLLQVTISNQTTSGAHKVVITSLMVSDDEADSTRAFSNGLDFAGEGNNVPG